MTDREIRTFQEKYKLKQDITIVSSIRRHLKESVTGERQAPIINFKRNRFKKIDAIIPGVVNQQLNNIHRKENREK